MPTFEFTAKAPDGQSVSGSTFGISIDHAMRDLTGKGLQILSIGVAANPGDPLADVQVPIRTAPQTETQARIAVTTASASPIAAPPTEQRSYMETSVWGPLVGQVPLKDLMFFFRQAATMLDAGVPIVQAMNTLANQANGRFQEILREMVRHVEAGNRLSDCMQRYPEVFSPVMLSLVRAGETGGFLDDSLEIVANYLDREIELRNLYRRVTFYPKLVIGASILIIIVANAIIASVAPGKPGLSSPLTEPVTWIVLTPLLIGGFLFLRVGLANHAVKYNWDQVMARLPYIGTTYRQLSMAKFGRAFGAMHKAGVPLSKALKISADACGNEYLRAQMYPAQHRLEEGVGVTEAFRDTGAFMPIVMDMVATGETSGNLAVYSYSPINCQKYQPSGQE